MTRLAVLFTQGCADWECAHLMATGRAHFGFEIVVVTPDGQPVTSAGGVAVTPQAALDSLDPDRVEGLIVCGGTAWQGEDPPEIARSVRAFSDAGRVIAGICDGVVALARTGILDAVAHTGNDRDQLAGVPGYRGPARYRDSPRAVRDGRIVTASGLAPVSFMAETVRALGYGGEDLDAYLGMLGAEHR